MVGISPARSATIARTPRIGPSRAENGAGAPLRRASLTDRRLARYRGAARGMRVTELLGVEES